MMTLELNEKERDMLKHALESFEVELRDEILRTDDREFKASLHDDEAVIKEIMKRVSMH